MFPIPDCSRSMGIHVLVLLAIAFGIAEFPAYGNTIHASKFCLNVSDGITCYFKGSEKHMSWSEATHHCRSFDSTLPVIRNENDQVVLAGYLRSNINNNEAWTAGKNFAYSGWTWINGDSFDGDVEEEEQVDLFNRKGEYAALKTNFAFTAQVASEELPYICQYETAYCKFSSDIKVNKKCLKLNDDSLSWYAARNQCLMTKGDLAVIGDAELEVLQQLTLNQSYWIGLRKKSFRWTLDDDVEPKDDIKYTNWDNAFAVEGEYITIGASNGTWKAVGYNEVMTVVCQRDQDVTSPSLTAETSAKTINTFASLSDESTTIGPHSTTHHGLDLWFAVVGVGIVIVICIIVIVVFVLRTKNGRSRQSKLNDGYAKNNGEELNTRITNAPVYTPINEPSDVPVNGSDDIRGVYADIALVTPEQSDDGGINQQPGIVYASLDFNKDPNNVEPNQTVTHSTSSPTKVGPLGDIYAIPDAKGHAVTSPGVGSASHPIKVTPQGDVYAIPMKISTSPTVNPPIGAVYANLPTATLNKEQMAVESDETK